MSRLKAIEDQVFVLSLAEGHIASSVLFALLRLGVFDLVGDGARTAEDLAGSVGAQVGHLTRLLNAGVVIGLLEPGPGGYRLTSPARSVLVRSAGDSYLGDWIRNMDLFRRALTDLDGAVLEGAPSVDPARHLGAAEDETRDFTLAMHNYAVFRGTELARFLDVGNATSLLDLGCGPGTYAFSLGKAHPSLELYLIDLPGVLDVAREVMKSFEIDNPVHFIPIDVNREEIPGGYDLVLVSNTLHMLGEEKSRALNVGLHDVVNPGGALVIQAQFLSDNRMGGRWPVFLDLIQMCITETGRNHTVSETTAWMESAGFIDIEFIPMSLVNTNSLLVGRRPLRESQP
jgi:SAM-dependent methyltransferase